MVSQADKEFVNNAGQRVVSNTLNSEEKDLGEELLELNAKAIKQKAVAQTLGVELGAKSPPPGDSGLASTIVNTAFNKMSDVQETLSKEKRAAEESAAAAYQEADQVKATFFQTQIKMLSDLQSEVRKQMEQLRTNNNPNSALAAVKDVMEIMALLQQRMAPAPSAEASRPPVSTINPEMEIRLTELKHNHELEMKKLDLQMQNQKQAFDLQLLQFQEDSKRRWAEWQDSQKTKSSAMNGLQDLAAAIGAGVEKERDGGSRTEESVISAQPSSNKAAVNNFPCQFCKTQIAVPPEAATVTCPNKECAAEYEIRRTG